MKNSPRKESIGSHMAIALQLLKRKNHQAICMAGHNITMEQLAILEVLEFQGDMNMTELSHAVWKQNANITRMIDKLEKMKLVVRNDVEGDRRANLLSITDIGSEAFKDIIPIVIQVYQDATSVITKKEEAITLKTLNKIIEHLT